MQSSLRKLYSRADNWLLSILGVMGIVFFYDTFHFRAAAALFPRIISAMVGVLCIYQLAENTWKTIKGRAEEVNPKSEKPVAIQWYWVILSMLVYFGLFYVVGFNLATVIFMVAFPPLVGYRRWVVIVPFAIVMTIAVAYCFEALLHVPMPTGWLGSLMGW